ncbi:hypothetical protein M9458_026569 [Cirrhinus mrigala]|uniref:Uncharacterized protein n=1 Tax=Cirrhinus mrigala TaxID=683832 RepID=A0ABD0PUI4_CIRMR
MGLCSSKSTVAVAPYAGVQNSESGDQADSTMQTSIWDDRTSAAQAAKNRTDAGVWSRGANPPAKGYLELGGKGEGELQTSREAEEEEDTDGDEVVELLNVSDSEGSLRSQYLD